MPLDETPRVSDNGELLDLLLEQAQRANFGHHLAPTLKKSADQQEHTGDDHCPQ